MTKVFDSKLSTPTSTLMRLTLHTLLGEDWVYKSKSTINEHLKINDDILPSGDVSPKLNYLVIGRKGHKIEFDEVDTDDGIAVPKGKRANMTGLYGIMPFVVREMDNDLTDEQRKMFRLRTKIAHEGINYWAYYVLVFDKVGLNIDEYLVTRETVDGVQNVTMSTLNYSDKDLYPVYKDLPDYDYDDDTKLIRPDGKYVTAIAKFKIEFTDFLVSEYMNTCAILRGSPSKAVMSEFALCSGVDVTVTGESATGSPFNYTEAYGVQALYHIGLYENAAVTNDSMSINIALTQAEPFFIGSE